MLRGNAPAKIDEKGRLKLPSGFRSLIGEHFGGEVFVTSLFGDCVWVYPMENWKALEARLARTPSTNQAVRKFRYRVNYYGQQTTIDLQGRVLIQPLLRQQAKTDGEVVVLGADDHLEVWNRSAFEAKLDSEPFTPGELDILSQFGI
jgi:MraZ protein